jgi:hypothetical protein
MWDRDHRRAVRQASRDQRRASRQALRAAQRSYRYNYYARRRSPFLRILLIILLAPLIMEILGLSWHVFFPLIPLAIIGIFVFTWLRNSTSGSGNSGFSGSTTNYQQPNQYYQSPQQPGQSNQYYQSPQPNTPSYQPYEQGYQAPPQSAHQQGVPPYQSNPSQSAQQQYEEPQAQYPQEMPPMV